MTTSDVQQFFDLAKVEGPVSEKEVEAVYDLLPAIEPNFMIGNWTGHSFDTGHPTHKLLKKVKWAGKNYRSIDDVDPIMVYDEAGNRVWAADYGNARLREVKFRGIVSAAMIYDKLPIIDVFHLVDDKTVIGAMDNKDSPNAGTYYFYLKRI